MSVFYITFGLSALILAFILMFLCFDLYHLFRVNVIVVMFVCHLLQQLLAATFMIFDHQLSASSEFFLACCVTSLLIPFGGLIGNIVMPVCHSQRVNFRPANIGEADHTQRKNQLFFSICFLLGMILLAIYVNYNRSMPLYGLVSGGLDFEEAKLARREASPGRLGWIFGITLRFYMPFLFLFGLLGVTYFRSLGYKLLCVLSMVTAFVYNAWAMSKTAVAILFLLAVIVLLLRKNAVTLRKCNVRITSQQRRMAIGKTRRYSLAIILFVALTIGYPCFIFVFKPIYVHGLEYILFQGVFLRVFLKPAINSYYVFEVFSHYSEYTYFRDIKKLSDLLGWQYFDMSEYIAIYKGQGSFTNAPPTAIGNFYAQGGWPVLVFGVLFAAALFKVIENLFYRARVKTPVHLALYTMLLYAAFRFSWANFHTILMTECIVPLLITLMAWNIISKLSLPVGGTHRATSAARLNSS